MEDAVFRREALTYLKYLQRGNEKLLAAAQAQLMGPDRIFTIRHRDRESRFHLPDPVNDYLQRKLVKFGAFYEHAQLEKVRPLIAPGATVLDVGAHIGNHAVYFATHTPAARVIAFEPLLLNVELLRKNIALNALDHVEVRRAAVGAGAGEAVISRPVAGNTGGGSLRAEAGGDIPLVALDDVIGGEAHFLKIDVEGMGAAVLEGARGLLGRCRPPVWIELRSGTDEQERAERVLGDLGYTGRRLDEMDWLYTCET